MVLVSEATRREIVEQAKHNGILSGLHISPEQEIALELWIRGQITLDYMIEEAKNRYGESSAVEN